MFDDMYADSARVNLEMSGALPCVYTMGEAPPIQTITLLDLNIEIVDRYDGSVRNVDVLTFLSTEVGRVRTGAEVTRDGDTWLVQTPLEDDGFVSRAVVKLVQA